MAEPPRRRYRRSQPRTTREPPWLMTPRGLQRAFRGASQAVVVRSVMLRLAQEIRAGREPTVGGNLRTAGYRYLLPVWAHLYGADAAWYTRLVRETRRLVCEWKLLSYRELDLTDAVWEARRIGERRPEIIAFAEDLDFVRFMRRVHRTLGITAMVLNGSPSAITSEYTAAHVAEAMEATGRAAPVHLLALTDYDPHGYDNARAFQRQLACFGLQDSTLTFVVGPELLSREERARAAVPLRRTGAMRTVLARWMVETGGVDGAPMKVEATSVPESRLLAALERAVSRIGAR